MKVPVAPPRDPTARTRGWTLLETVVALSLLLVLTPVMFPPIEHELIYLRERLETESARLIVEGELGRARQELAGGRLGAEERALDVAAFYGSQSQLRELTVRRTVSRMADEALWEVTIHASWRSAVAVRGECERALELTTWSAVR